MKEIRDKVCKFETALIKTMHQERNQVIKAIDHDQSSGKMNNDPVRRGVGNGGVALPKRVSKVDDKRRRERAENLVHLICWGPN